MGMKLYDGVKAIPLEKLPAEAWASYGGGVGEVAKLYEGVGWLYRCVQVRANTLMALPYDILRGTEVVATGNDFTDDELEQDWLSELRRLMYLTEAALCLAGEAFWLKERNRVKTLGVRWLAPSTMTPQWNESKGLVGFSRYMGAGDRLNLDVDEVVYFNLPNPLHETKPGTPPASAASISAGVLWSMDEFATGFFDRGAIKATLLTVDGNPPRSELEKLESWWKRFFRGVGSAWETAAVRAGVVPVTIGDGVSELSNGTLTKEQREAIATAMGVPHSLVFSNAATFATAKTDALNFYNQTILPNANLVEDALNTQLLDGEGLRLRFRPDRLSIMQEDEEQRSGALVNLTNAGIPLRAAMEMLGYTIPEDMPEGEPRQYTTGPTEPDTRREPDQSEAGLEADRQAAAQYARDQKAFRRWLKGRKNPDPALFESAYLSAEDKFAIMLEGEAHGAAKDSFFTPAYHA